MTTIAYANGLLAADTLITERGGRLGHKTKIVSRNGILATGAGSAIICRQFTDWFLRGMKGEPPEMKPHPQGPSSECVIFIGPSRFLTFDCDGVSEVTADYYTLGSGAPYAKGAMAAGADAIQAVRIAIEHDIYSGGEVQSLQLRLKQ